MWSATCLGVSCSLESLKATDLDSAQAFSMPKPPSSSLQN